MSDLSAYTPRKVDAAYANSLVDFILACRRRKVEIDEIAFYMNGWKVTFVGCKGDAICHDGSYGSPCYGAILDETAHQNDWSQTGSWETIGFPWDGDDVSVHDSYELAAMISDFQRGEYHEEDWE
jgi:hypothetical protein